MCSLPATFRLLRLHGAPEPACWGSACGSRCMQGLSTVASVSGLLLTTACRSGQQVMELKLKVDNAERERDFYFDKLRDIEILCQTPGLADIPVQPAAVQSSVLAMQGHVATLSGQVHSDDH